jgi:outer membrane protein assembly factor BamB
LKYSAKLADVKVAITENNLSIRDIAISNHHLFVLHEQQVRVFSLDGDFIRSFESKSSKAGNLILAARFAIDEDGDIFVTDSDTNMVHIFSNDGEFLMLFGDSPVTVLDCPQFICARDSFVYVSDKGNSRITIFDRSGQLIQQSFVEDIVPNSSGLIVSEISGLYLLGEFLYLTFASQNAIVAVSRKTLSFDSCFRWKEDISESDDSAIISISIDSLNYLLYILDTREQYIKVYQETIFCSKSSM